MRNSINNLANSYYNNMVKQAQTYLDEDGKPLTGLGDERARRQALLRGDYDRAAYESGLADYYRDMQAQKSDSEALLRGDYDRAAYESGLADYYREQNDAALSGAPRAPQGVFLNHLSRNKGKYALGGAALLGGGALAYYLNRRRKQREEKK